MTSKLLNKSECGKCGHKWKIVSFICRHFTFTKHEYNPEINPDKELCIYERCIRCGRFEIDFVDEKDRFDI